MRSLTYTSVRLISFKLTCNKNQLVSKKNLRLTQSSVFKQNSIFLIAKQSHFLSVLNKFIISALHIKYLLTIFDCARKLIFIFAI